MKVNERTIMIINVWASASEVHAYGTANSSSQNKTSPKLNPYL